MVDPVCQAAGAAAAGEPHHHPDPPEDGGEAAGAAPGGELPGGYQGSPWYVILTLSLKDIYELLSDQFPGEYHLPPKSDAVLLKIW